MSHELLGDWKASSEWLTPDGYWSRVYFTLTGYDSPSLEKPIYDPCPHKGSGGLDKDWTQHKYVYVNPPTPPSEWATKAIESFQQNPDINILYACYSEAVLWQVNNLESYPHIKVRHRISWIDGSEFKKITDKKLISKNPEGMFQDNGGNYYIPNPRYLEPATSPRNYSAFVLLSNSLVITQRFCDSFSDLGSIQLRRLLYRKRL